MPLSNQSGLRTGGLNNLSFVGLPDSDNVYYRWEATGLSESDGQVVDPWEDLEKGHRLSANGDPSVNAGSFNGEDMIDLDGSGDWYTEPSSFTSLSQPFTYYLVLDLDTANDQRVISEDGGVPLRYDGSQWWVQFGSSLYGSSDSTSNLITVRADGSSSVIREDEAETASGNLGTDSLSDLWVGGKFGDAGDELVDGRFGEIIFYDVGHDTATIGDVEAFLSNKWGI